MAMAPPRPCPRPRCGRLNCQLHQVPAWRTRSSPPVVRIRGRQLQAMRARLFARYPFCVVCITGRATIRDHTIPLAEGGRDDASNEQALCRRCSDAKTRTESARGMRRQ